jgi:hypothetical protein
VVGSDGVDAPQAGCIERALGSEEVEVAEATFPIAVANRVERGGGGRRWYQGTDLCRAPSSRPRARANLGRDARPATVIRARPTRAPRSRRLAAIEDRRNAKLMTMAFSSGPASRRS